MAQFFHPECVDLYGEVSCVVVDNQPRQFIGFGMDETSGICSLPEGIAFAEGRQKLVPEEVPVDLNLGKR